MQQLLFEYNDDMTGYQFIILQKGTYIFVIMNEIMAKLVDSSPSNYYYYNYYY